ncbi:MAG: hypothetical protein R2852_02985 [Bacteroidia bacterium]
MEDIAHDEICFLDLPFNSNAYTSILRLLVILILFNITSLAKAQTFNKTYEGWWARTKWTFDFNLDGTCHLITWGHYGNTRDTGMYTVNADTLYLTHGLDETNQTLDKYLIDHDSFIVDLNLFYDYKLVDTKTSFYNSKKRFDILKKPNMDSVIIVSREQFATLVEECNLLLNTHRIGDLEDEKHIKIIRLYNTLCMSSDTTYENGIYDEFMKQVFDKSYLKELAIYYDWIPNRGMGMYFLKLQVELGGTPHLYSRYTIQ